MKNKYTIIFTFAAALSFLVFGCKKESDSKTELAKSTASLHQPGEFEEQESIWIIWPTVGHIKSLSNKAVALDIIGNIYTSEKVNICVNDATVQAEAEKMLSEKGISGTNIAFHIIPSVQMWIRDMGPIFVIDNDGKKNVVDFNFNTWGYSDDKDPYNTIEEKFDELVGADIKTKVLSSNLISEGGDRELNGKGTLMCVETVELGRNPNMTKPEIEAEFKKMLGVTNVIWLKEGVREDDHTFRGVIKTKSGENAYTLVTTNGHIDEHTRFVNANTIVMAEVDAADLDDPLAQENKRRMDINYEILKNAKDQDGKPFTIIRMPMPNTIIGNLNPGDEVYDYIATLDYQDGTKFPVGKPVKGIVAASYCNFLIANKVVLAQKYYKPGMDLIHKQRDEKSKLILESIFPDRKIIQIDALSTNYGGGGVHCITMHETK